MNELINTLNNASNACYNRSPIMSDYEWGKLFDELATLEYTTDLELAASPTHNVCYAVAAELMEVAHNHPMLSLDKTISVDELITFIEAHDCFKSVHCVGLATWLRYLDGSLGSAETRVDVEDGQDVLQNGLTMHNIPKGIPYKAELIMDVEAIIVWDTF